MCVISASPGETTWLFTCTRSISSNGPLDTPGSGKSVQSCNADFEMYVVLQLWSPLHHSVRYKEHDDGFLRLQLIRYESVELTEQLMREKQNRQADEDGGQPDNAQGMFTFCSEKVIFNPYQCTASFITLLTKLSHTYILCLTFFMVRRWRDWGQEDQG